MYLMQFEQKVEVVTHELEKTQSEHMAKMFEKEQVNTACTQVLLFLFACNVLNHH